MALIFTFPHLDSTVKGDTGKLQRINSRGTETRSGIQLSGAPVGREFPGRLVCFRAAPDPPPQWAGRK